MNLTNLWMLLTTNLNNRVSRFLLSVFLPGSVFLVTFLIPSSGAFEEFSGSIAHAASVQYPLAGNLRPQAGTMEMWIRLDADPGEKGQFPLVTIDWAQRHLPLIRFSYGYQWLPNEHHVMLRLDGHLEGGGEPSTTIYASKSNTWTGQIERDHPRHPSLAKGEWHHLAFTWKNVNLPTMAIYLDGKMIVPAAPTVISVWSDPESATIHLPEGNVTWDELKISSRILTLEEIAQSFTRGALEEDEHTLLLDHFDEVEDGKTLPAQIAGYKGETGGVVKGQNYLVTKGKFGGALQLIAPK